MPRHRTRFTLFSLSEQRYAVGSVTKLRLRGLDIQSSFLVTYHLSDSSASAKHTNLAALLGRIGGSHFSRAARPCQKVLELCL